MERGTSQFPQRVEGPRLRHAGRHGRLSDPEAAGWHRLSGAATHPSPPGDRRVRRVHFGNHRVGDGVPPWPGPAGHFRANRPRRDLGPSRGDGRSRILRTTRTTVARHRSRQPLRRPTCWPTGTRDNASLPPQVASPNGGRLAVPNPPPFTATHASRGRRVSNLGTRTQPRSRFLSLAEVDVGQELPAPIGHDQQLGHPAATPGPFRGNGRARGSSTSVAVVV